MLKRITRLLGLGLLLSTASLAQPLPSPKEAFAFNIGDDYQLANFTQTEAYFRKLAASPRVKMVDIGLTEEGRHQYMLVVTSPENHRKLDRYQQISRQLARAEGLGDEQARALSEEGRAVVWIDGGLHSNETVGMQQLIETAWQLCSRTDAETMRILDNCIVLLVMANPDGQELMSNWYMRNPTASKRTLDHLPRLYQKYAGHDNNRDFYIMNLKETQNMGRQLFVEWIPQIMYNHHQRGPAGSVLAGPPYRDPFNYVFDPLMITGIDAVGAAMVNRLNAEGKPGYTRLNGSVFSTWYNGGLRTTTHFHNMIGLLTEIIGGPTPETIPLVPSRLLPNNATPMPVLPQVWRFKQSIDYSLSLNYATLDYAARHRDQLLYNIYRMGKNSIERGSRDYWTLSPRHIDAITKLQQADRSRPTVRVQPPAAATTARPDTAKAAPADSSLMSIYGSRVSGVPMRYFDAVLKNPATRDARGYIIPAGQTDWPRAVAFVNALIRTGIEIRQATAAFSVGGKNYPAGSYVVKLDQAFRPHILDMFEPQDHPNDFQYPGGPPIRPYDAAGWTLAYLMGVQFDRVLEGFDGPFKKLPVGELQQPTGTLTDGPAGYVLSGQSNQSFAAVNTLLKAGVEVFRTPEGDFFAGSKASTLLGEAARQTGLNAKGTARRPATATRVRPLRVGLWDTYGGSMASGWVRLLMERYNFPAKVIYAEDIDGGKLADRFDVLVFVTRAIPAMGSRGAENEYGFAAERGPRPEDIPAEFRPWLGRLTAEKSVPVLKQFLEKGGRIVTIGTSTALAYHLGLPVQNALTEMGPDGTPRPLPSDKYFIPGSVLRVSLDSTNRATWGMHRELDVYFDASPVFRLSPEAVARGQVRPLLWFGSPTPLRSGWAWGQAYLNGGVAAFEAPVGRGKLVAFGPEITFRAQAHGTFRLLFNQLLGE